MVLEKAKLILKTSRPILWLMHYCEFLLAMLFIDSWHLLSPINLYFIIFFGPILSIFIYGLNDYSDYDSDIINDRKDGIFGLKHKENNKNFLLYSSLIIGGIFIVSTLFFNIYAFLLALFISFLLIFYSIRPLRFKNIPILDNITGGGLYGCLLVPTAFLIAGGKVENLYLLKDVIIYLFAGGFAFQALGAIFDEVPDKKSNARTSATFFGKRVVIIYTSIILIIAIFILNVLFFKIVLLSLLIYSITITFTKLNESKFIKKWATLLILIAAFVSNLIYLLINR
ncbi:UbiA family prenyltransferase [Candidatus Dojkabacteria bacterium]|jgi:4-hydroxybenzoate polyprenyltransferase|nr:UbiA family prenyltransferase [Candidatus Dojkabacteria bacterium]